MKEILFELLRNEICGEEISDETKKGFLTEIFADLFKVSKIHDIAHLISDSLYKNGLLPSDSPAFKAFMHQQQLAVFRYEQINYEVERISDIFESEKIPFVPLKGSILRKYYPEPWMRTSCDIDVLVKEEDLDRASAVLVEKYGCERTYNTEHDVSFNTSSNVHLELHFSLIEDNSSAEILKNVWGYTKLLDGKLYHYEMIPEMFYFYHVAHMAKHFELGGCGVRTFIDLYLLNKYMTYDHDVVEELLSKSRLTAFNVAATKLSMVWMANVSHDQVTIEMEEYLLKAGIYGSVENKIAAEQVNKGGKFRYFLRRIFLPYKSLKLLYPIIEKHKILTPFCGIHRWFSIVFGGRVKKAMYELKTNNNLSLQKKEKVKKLFESLELQQEI